MKFHVIYQQTSFGAEIGPNCRIVSPEVKR
jgi:hypothetical protein